MPTRDQAERRFPPPPLRSTEPPSDRGGSAGPQGRDRLHERGLYIESWLPERRSRRRPLLFLHGELSGSWVWERYLGYFAGRGWEGHALNLRAHFWSATADPASLSFDTYTDVVVAAMRGWGRAWSSSVAGWGVVALKAADATRSGRDPVSVGLPRDSGRPPVA